MRSVVTSVIVASTLTATLAGCTPALSDEDATALHTLASVAGPTSGVEANLIENTECWLPSVNLLDDPSSPATTWRVMCRVHWAESDTAAARYQDTTCIGDFAARPMLDHCYRWTHYDLMPEFEDQDSVIAG